MPFRDFLKKETISIDLTARSKTAVLLSMSKLMCKNDPKLSCETLFDAYWKRETLGSTTIGHGIMIPHICTDSVEEIHGCFLKLRNPVDFGADDKQPVDLVLGLAVAPHKIDEHLKILARIVKQFSIQEFILQCRHAIDNEVLCSLLTAS